jgi:dTDP-4-dehydrorhamnose reductase
VRALIFGAKGQVGRALAETAPAGVHFVALGRAECDIRRRAEVERAIALAKPDLVFNAAAFTAVDQAEADAAAATALNAVAPGIIAAAARAAGARTIHISTDYVFDGQTERPYRPDDPPNPLSVYGRTKIQGEKAVREADPRGLTVRTMWLYSRWGTNFVTTMLRLMREREQLQVVSDQFGAPTSARSLAMALWALAGAGATGLLHYRDAGTASWYEFAAAIQEQACALGILERSIPLAPVAGADYRTVAPRPRYSVLDASDAWRIIGGSPPHWRDNVHRMLEEVCRHG